MSRRDDLPDKPHRGYLLDARWRPRCGVKVPDVGSARLHL